MGALSNATSFRSARATDSAWASSKWSNRVDVRLVAQKLTRHSLAMMEIYLGVAHIFRRFHLNLYETDRTDVLMYHEFFLPAPVLTSKGVRAKITEIYD